MSNRSDNFNRADSTTALGAPSDGGAGYTTSTDSGGGGHTFGIGSNRAVLTGSGAINVALLAGASADADVACKSYGALSGPAARAADRNNCYYLHQSSGNLYCRRRVAGSDTDLAIVARTWTNGDTLTIRCQGTTVIFKHNSATICTATGESNTLSGNASHGIWSYSSSSAALDDLAITDLGQSFVADRAKVLTGTGTVTLALTGTNTTWTGSPFSLSGTPPSGWSLASQSVTSGTAATVTLNRGTGTGTLTLSDGTLSATVTATGAATTIAAGNWSAGATWDTAEAPGNGHTATVAHAATVDATTTLGTSPSDSTTLVLTVQTAGSLTVNPGVTFTLRGNAQVGNTSVQVGTTGGGGTWEFDASAATTTTTNYLCTLGSGSGQTAARLVTRGTSGSRSVVRSNAGGGNGSFGDGGLTDAGRLDLAYTDCLRLGTATTDALQAGVTSGGLTALALDHCTFDSCGRVNTTATVGGTSGFSLADSTWSNPLATDLRISAATASGAPTRSVARCVFAGGVAVAASGTSYADCFLPDGVTDSGSGWSAMDRCLLWMGRGGAAAITGTNIYGPLADCYVLADTTSGNSHVLIPRVTGTYSGLVLDNNSDDTSAGDNSDLIYTGDALTLTLLNSIICRSEIENSGAGTLNFNPTAVLKVRHCSGWSNNALVSLGDLSFGVGTLAEYKSNAVRSTGGSDWHVNYKTQQASPTFANAMTAAGAVNNCGYNLAAGHMGGGYNTNNTDGTPGAGDLFGTDPQWVDPYRTAGQWALARGFSSTTGTTATAVRQRYADAITALRADFVTRNADLLAWIRAGFAPQNVALKDAGHDGVTIGAVEFQAPPQSVTVPAAVLHLSAPAPTATPGAVSRTVPVASVSLSAPALTATPGGVSRTVPTALLRPAAVAPTASVGGIARAVPLASVSLAAPAPAVTPGAVSRPVPAAVLHPTAVAPTVTAGGVSRALPVATLALSTLTPDVSLGSGTQSRTVPMAVLHLGAPAPTVVAGAVSRTVPPALLHLGARAPATGPAQRAFVDNFGETAYPAADFTATAYPEPDWTVATQYPPR